MKQLTISEPKLIGETEWVSIKFHGQSFMLHQIRKMIGLLVLIARTGAAEGLVDECFGPARVHIPKAPGLGLLLERPIFNAYNTRISNNNDKIQKLIRKSQDKASSLHDELRSPVTYSDHSQHMDRFKQLWIYDRITSTERETYEFGKWLNYLDVFQGPDFEFLNPNGVIPQQCIVKVGEFHRDSLRNEARQDRQLRNGYSGQEEEDQEALGKKGAELDEYEG